MDAVRLELLPGVFLTQVRAERYKTNVMTAYFARPLDGAEASLNALLPQVLCRGNQSHTDLRSMSEAMDDLYGASLIGGVRKVGEWQTFGLSCDYIGDAFTGSAQTSGMAGLLTETLLRPALDGGVFRTDYVESERGKLIDAILAQKNDKAAYAMRRLEALACGGEPYGVCKLGDQDSMAAITPERLWEHYQKVLDTSRLELFYCGDSPEAAELLRAGLRERLGGVRGCALQDAPFVARAGETRTFSETADVTQAKLAMLWRTGIRASDPGFMAAYLASVLYGGGTTSKLFLNVRERLSLCYYAMASLDRHKGVMKAQSGVEPDNFARARDEMLRQWDEVMSGNFSEQDMFNAKALLTNAWRSQCDSPGGLELFWHGQSVSGQRDSARDWESALADVTAADVTRAARSFTLDSVYVLKGEDVR